MEEYSFGTDTVVGIPDRFSLKVESLIKDRYNAPPLERKTNDGACFMYVFTDFSS